MTFSRRRRASSSQYSVDTIEETSFTRNRRRKVIRQSPLWLWLSLASLAAATLRLQSFEKMHYSSGDQRRSVMSLEDFSIQVAMAATHSSEFYFPRQISYRTNPYYGLRFKSLSKNSFQREIQQNDTVYYGKEREELLQRMGRPLSSTLDHDDELDRPRECERNNWRSTLYVNCNTFHETDLGHADLYNKTFLGKGYYRYAWLMKPRYLDPISFVMKQMRLPRDENDLDHLPHARSQHKIQNEAIIMERLSSSPTIVDIYGHCSTSILAETMPMEVTKEIIPSGGYIKQTELNQKATHIQNNLTMEEKLNMAIEMAESMAEIHGFAGGVIVHGDIHPVQYLRSVGGKIKLNDFNNAEVLDWDPRDNTYCPTDRGRWGGMYRSPEEFRGDPIDEKIDVFSLGNNFYTLLTGLWPFYEDKPYTVVQTKVLAMETPFIDDRYRKGHVIERTLVMLMEMCWRPRPRARPSVFEILDTLRNTKAAYQQEQQR